MKKRILRIFALALALVLALSLGGCGVVKSLIDRAAPTPEPTPTPEPVSSAVTPTGMYATVKEFVDDNRATLDAAVQAQMISQPGLMTIAVDGTTDRLIYSFTFTDSAMEDVDQATLVSALEDGLEEQDFVDTFTGIAASVEDIVAVDAVKVDVIYCAPDGSELTKRTYTSGGASPADSKAGAGASSSQTVTMRTYLEANRDAIYSQLAGQIANSDEVADMILEATDDTLIYRVIMDDDAVAGMEDDELSSILYEALNSEDTAASFNSMVSLLEVESGVSPAKALVSYEKSDGTILATKEFAGN